MPLRSTPLFRHCVSVSPVLNEQELEANEEYVEREDEFDVNERPASPAANECAPEGFADHAEPSSCIQRTHERRGSGIRRSSTLVAVPVVAVGPVHRHYASPRACRRGADASDTEVDIVALDPELRGLSSDDEGAAGPGAPAVPRPLTHLPIVIPQQADLVDLMTRCVRPLVQTSSRT